MIARLGLPLALGVALVLPLVGQNRAQSAVVSADILRYPLREKPRRMLRKALNAVNSADHPAAIALLKETLVRYPEAAAYAHSILGVEYIKTNQFADAVDSFEEAVRLLPHDSMNRYNLALALACAGQYARSEQEVRRAIEMDPHNETIRALLAALRPREEPR